MPKRVLLNQHLRHTDRIITKKQMSPFSTLNVCSSTDLYNNASTTFFPSNFRESTMSETFLKLTSSGFFNNSRKHKRSRVTSECDQISTFQVAISDCCVEPSHEPCTDEISWSELVFWLGNVSTGELLCSCTQCTQRVMREYSASLHCQQRYMPYEQQQQQQMLHVSSRVPTINVPRIEGVNC
ncbi:hypothetical protein Plhal304r1_c012g0045071 [Plasmopara halstedii]